MKNSYEKALNQVLRDFLNVLAVSVPVFLVPYFLFSKEIVQSSISFSQYF